MSTKKSEHVYPKVIIKKATDIDFSTNASSKKSIEKLEAQRLMLKQRNDLQRRHEENELKRQQEILDLKFAIKLQKIEEKSQSSFMGSL